MLLLFNNGQMDGRAKASKQKHPWYIGGREESNQGCTITEAGEKRPAEWAEGQNKPKKRPNDQNNQGLPHTRSGRREGGGNNTGESTEGGVCDSRIKGNGADKTLGSLPEDIEG